MVSKGTIAPILHTGGLAALAMRLSRDEFARRFPHPFLSRPRKLDTDEYQTASDWETSIRTFDGRSAAAVPALAALRFAPIARKGHSPYTEFVAVGRAENCDLVLKGRSISKLHALLWIPTDSHPWTVSDARSANGTFINGTRIPALDRFVIQPGDCLQFGEVATRFLDAGQVFDLLNPSASRCEADHA